MKKYLKFVIIGTVILIALAVSLYFYLTNQPITEVTQVYMQDFVDYDKEDGDVIANDPVYLTTLLSNQVEVIFVSEGEMLSQGQKVLQLNTDSLESQLDVLLSQRAGIVAEKQAATSSQNSAVNNQKIAMDLAEAAAKSALEDYEQAQTLFDKGVISENELKLAEERYNQSYGVFLQQQTLYYAQVNQSHAISGNNSQLNIIDSQIDEVRRTIKDSTIVASSEGILTNFTIKKGQIVSPSMILGMITPSDDFSIESYLLTENTVNLSVNDPVIIEYTLEGVTNQYEGIISFIAPSAVKVISSLGIEENRVRVLVKPNQPIAKVRLGSQMDIRFIIASEDDTFVIPKTAIFTNDNIDYVLAVEDGEAVKREVITGIESDANVSIVQGLEEGDIVVSNYKSNSLQPGDSVNYEID